MLLKAPVHDQLPADKDPIACIDISVDDSPLAIDLNQLDVVIAEVLGVEAKVSLVVYPVGHRFRSKVKLILTGCRRADDDRNSVRMERIEPIIGAPTALRT